MQPDLHADLVKYLATFDVGPCMVNGKYFYVVNPKFNDFNREIVKPNTNVHFPDGAVGIRVDDDFWIVAILPYKYAELSIQELVAIIWPAVTDPYFNPDSDKEAWRQKYLDSEYHRKQIQYLNKFHLYSKTDEFGLKSFHFNTRWFGFDFFSNRIFLMKGWSFLRYGPDISLGFWKFRFFLVDRKKIKSYETSVEKRH